MGVEEEREEKVSLPEGSKHSEAGGMDDRKKEEKIISRYSFLVLFPSLIYPPLRFPLISIVPPSLSPPFFCLSFSLSSKPASWSGQSLEGGGGSPGIPLFIDYQFVVFDEDAVSLFAPEVADAFDAAVVFPHRRFQGDADPSAVGKLGRANVADQARLMSRRQLHHAGHAQLDPTGHRRLAHAVGRMIRQIRSRSEGIRRQRILLLLLFLLLAASLMMLFRVVQQRRRVFLQFLTSHRHLLRDVGKLLLLLLLLLILHVVVGSGMDDGRIVCRCGCRRCFGKFRGG